MNDFFKDLAQRFARVAERQGRVVDPPVLTGDISEEILELARVVAHTTERRFAPLASFMAGAAVERLRRADPALGEEALARYVRAVREELESAT